MSNSNAIFHLLKNRQLRNPFKFNIFWLSCLTLAMILLLFHPFFDIVWLEIWKLVFIGVLYSALVLLLSEIVQLFRDKKEFGVLAGDYERENWFEKIEKSRRAEDLMEEEKQQQLRAQKGLSQVHHTKSSYMERAKAGRSK